MKNLITIVLLLTSFSLRASGGHDTGGGGIGVPVDGRIYLYDFIEGGIEESAFIDEGIADEMRALPSVEASIATTPEVQSLIVAKLNEVYAKSPTAALALLEMISSMGWRFVASPLRETDDIGRTPFRNRLERRQIAVRDDRLKVVSIDRDYLALMPVSHQVGLFFHEIIYALSGQTDSANSRMLVAYVFSSTFARQTPAQFIARAQPLFQAAPLRTYTEYHFRHSPSYTAACDSLKASVNRIFHEYYGVLQEQHNLASQAARRLRNCTPASLVNHSDHAVDWIERIEDQAYTFALYSPSNHYPVRMHVPFVRHCRSARSPAPVYYTMPDSVITRLRNLAQSAVALGETEETRLFGGCFDAKTKVLIRQLPELVAPRH